MQYKDIIFFGMVILLIGLCIWMIHLIKSETSECVKNPYLYGASHMGNVYCSCYQGTGGSCPATFSFNDTYLDLTPNICGDTQSMYKAIDLGSLNLTVAKP